MGKRISQLDAASVVTGAEMIPVVQGGLTKRLTALALKEYSDTSCQCTLVSRYNTVGTDADTKIKYLQTYQMPADTLSTDGSWLEIIAWGTLASNGNQKTTVLYFGSNATSTGLVTSGGNWTIEAKIIRTSATTQKILADFEVFGVVSGKDVGASLTENLASTVTIAITGQNGTASANDIVCHGLIVRLNKMDADS